MKNLKVTTRILVIAFAIVTVTSCKDSKKEHDNNDGENIEMNHDNDEQHLAFACPMKCEGDKTYEKAGSCSVCGMDLKEVPKLDEDKSELSDEMAMVYACPMKCEGDKTYDKEGSCPKCGMDLKEMKSDKAEDHSGHDHD